jgi:flagellar biosynthesis/type III secretory pathway protein FliH
MRKNPAFKERETVTIKSRAMEKIIAQAYDEGYKQGQEEQKASDNLFNSMFGGRK